MARLGRPIHGRRWVTHDACEAFVKGQPFKRAQSSMYYGGSSPGTEVRVPIRGRVEMYLHGHKIAEWDKKLGTFNTTLAGFNTPTTRERLNGLLSAMLGRGYIYTTKGYGQRNYAAIFGDEEIDSRSWQSHKLVGETTMDAGDV